MNKDIENGTLNAGEEVIRTTRQSVLKEQIMWYHTCLNNDAW